MRNSHLSNAVLALLAVVAFTSCSSHRASSPLTPSGSQPTSRALILQSAKTDGRLSRLWDKIQEARAHPVSDLPRKGKPVAASAGVALPRDLVNLLDDVVFPTQARDKSVRLFVLSGQTKESNSRARSLKFSNPSAGGCLEYVYFWFYYDYQGWIDDAYIEDPLIHAASLPICVEFDPDWLANFLAGLQTMPAGGGTSFGCYLYASNCYLIDGDDANVISYATGEGGLYTAGPWGCQQTTSGWFSTVDGGACSPWQTIFYAGVYTGRNLDVPNVHIPVSIWYQESTANSKYPSGGPNAQVLNGGHTYVALWGYGVVQLSTYVIQGGKKDPPNDTKLAYIPGPQNNALTDIRFPLAVGEATSIYQWGILNSLGYTFQANSDAGMAQDYNFLFCNSNRWTHSLLTSEGYSEQTLIIYEGAMTVQSLASIVPYGGFGPGTCDLSTLF